jgi:hypothetical protein
LEAMAMMEKLTVESQNGGSGPIDVAGRRRRPGADLD